MQIGAREAAVRARNWIDYKAQFDVVLSHVHEHLDDPLDLVTLSQLAGFSPKHWHRVYASAFGETLPATVKRLRMQRASSLLANSGLTVAEIAKRVGYPNVASFTRAFGASYGLPPALYRAAGRHNDFRLASESFDPDAFDVEIRTIETIECLAVEHRGSYLGIDQAFTQLTIWYAARELVPSEQRYLGAFLSDPSLTDEAELRSMACFPRPSQLTANAPSPVSAEATEIVDYTIQGGPYAVLTHIGPYSDMPAKYAWLFGCWVVASGRQLADRPVIEQYVSAPQNANPNDIVTEIWLPLAEGE